RRQLGLGDVDLGGRPTTPADPLLRFRVPRRRLFPDFSRLVRLLESRGARDAHAPGRGGPLDGPGPGDGRPEHRASVAPGAEGLNIKVDRLAARMTLPGRISPGTPTHTSRTEAGAPRPRGNQSPD